MYSVPYPISTIRTRIRQEFERNRFVNKISVVDVLLLKANADYQVRASPFLESVIRWCSQEERCGCLGTRGLFAQDFERSKEDWGLDTKKTMTGERGAPE